MMRKTKRPDGFSKMQTKPNSNAMSTKEKW